MAHLPKQLRAMKRILILLLALVSLQSCGALFAPDEPQQKATFATFLDFRPYTSEGFFISPDSYTGDHETLGELFLTVMPEQKEITESKRSKYDEVQYINGILYGYEIIPYAELLEQAVLRAVSIGADGIADLKIAKYANDYSVRYEVTGLCIKRK